MSTVSAGGPREHGGGRGRGLQPASGPYGGHFTDPHPGAVPSVESLRVPAPGTYGPPPSCSMEMCDHRQNITMCPLCDKTCSYWKMSSACATARASHLFDNPATVFFSVFMALWGKQSLAAWRRRGRGDFASVPPWPSFRLDILHRLRWPGLGMGGRLGGGTVPRCACRWGGSGLGPGYRLVLLTHALRKVEGVSALRNGPSFLGPGPRSIPAGSACPLFGEGYQGPETVSVEFPRVTQLLSVQGKEGMWGFQSRCPYFHLPPRVQGMGLILQDASLLWHLTDAGGVGGG